LTLRLIGWAYGRGYSHSEKHPQVFRHLARTGSSRHHRSVRPHRLRPLDPQSRLTRPRCHRPVPSSAQQPFDVRRTARYLNASRQRPSDKGKPGESRERKATGPRSPPRRQRHTPRRTSRPPSCRMDSLPWRAAIRTEEVR